MSEDLPVTSDHSPTSTAPITGLSHVQLQVSDLGVSARWYSAVLSLVAYAQDLDSGYIALLQPDAKLVVVLTERAQNPDAVERSTNDALDHLAFAASDGGSLRVWADHLSESGIEHDGVILENGHPSLQLRDPDGIAIELVAP